MFHSLEKFQSIRVGYVWYSQNYIGTIVKILIDFLLIYFMLIDPPNKANAQENTKIFPGLCP